MQFEIYAPYAMALLLLVKEGHVESHAPYAMALLLLVEEAMSSQMLLMPWPSFC